MCVGAFGKVAGPVHPGQTRGSSTLPIAPPNSPFIGCEGPGFGPAEAVLACRYLVPILGCQDTVASVSAAALSGHH